MQDRGPTIGSTYRCAPLPGQIKKKKYLSKKKLAKWTLPSALLLYLLVYKKTWNLLWSPVQCTPVRIVQNNSDDINLLLYDLFFFLRELSINKILSNLWSWQSRKSRLNIYFILNCYMYNDKIIYTVKFECYWEKTRKKQYEN